MTAIVSSSNPGLGSISLDTLRPAGETQARSDSGNAQSHERDDFLAARSDDHQTVLTYDSQGRLSGGDGSQALAQPDDSSTSALFTTESDPAAPAIDTVFEPEFDEFFNRHLCISSEPGSIAVGSVGSASFEAGETITVFIRFKSDACTAPAIRLFGTDPEHEAVSTTAYGNGDWQTVTLALTLKTDDILYISLGAVRNPAQPGQAAVLYKNFKCSSGDWLSDDSLARGINFTSPEKLGLDRVTLQPSAEYQLRASPSGNYFSPFDWVTRGAVACCKDDKLAGYGSSSVKEADLKEAPLQPFSLQMGTGLGPGYYNSNARRYLGQFEAGDVLTLSIRAKADHHSMTAVWLGGDYSYWRNVTCVYGNDGWQTITVTATLKEDETLYVDLGGDAVLNGAPMRNKVWFQDLQVSSVQRGDVLRDDFGSIEYANLSDVIWPDDPEVGVWYTSGSVTQRVEYAAADFEAEGRPESR